MYTSGNLNFLVNFFFFQKVKLSPVQTAFLKITCLKKSNSG